jgi:hypothetical protein
VSRHGGGVSLQTTRSCGFPLRDIREVTHTLPPSPQPA